MDIIESSITDERFNIAVRDALRRLDMLTRTWRDSSVILDGRMSTYDEFIARSVTSDVERFVFDSARDVIHRMTMLHGIDPTIVTGSMMSMFSSTAQQQVERPTSRRPTRNDIVDIVSQQLHDPTRQMLIEALDTAGACGRVFVINDKDACKGNCMPMVEISGGHHIDGAHVILAEQRASSYVDPRVVVFDGVISSVHEIDDLFVQATELRDPIVIFARHFDEDVLNTIVYNNRAGRFTIVPISFPNDPSGNILDDIALICGVQMITAAAFGSLRQINIGSASCVDTIRCAGSTIVIENAATNEACMLRSSQHAEQHVHDEQRIRRLSTSSVTIRCHDETSASSLTRVLSAITSMIKHGVIDVNASTAHGHVVMNARMRDLSVIPAAWCSDVERSCQTVTTLLRMSSVMLIMQQDDR